MKEGYLYTRIIHQLQSQMNKSLSPQEGVIAEQTFRQVFFLCTKE
jgi:hypothetical protein